MSRWKEGSRVRIVSRDVTEQDRKSGRYFAHMGGLTGTVQNVYGPQEVAVKVDKETLGAIPLDVHTVAIERMRDKFMDSISEEQKKNLTPQELSFDAHYVLLVSGSDLESA